MYPADKVDKIYLITTFPQWAMLLAKVNEKLAQ
jgi:hypothetical protein